MKNKQPVARNQRPDTKQIDLDHIAKLANIPISDKEKERFGKQLEDVLSYFSKLKEVDTEKIQPIANVADLQNVTREDQPAPSLTQEEALSGASKKHDGFFEVDAIFEEE